MKVYEEECTEAGVHTATESRMRLLVRHPSVTPKEITARLGLEPNVAHTVGEPRQTPKGTPLLGTYRYSAWSHRVSLKEERFFENASIPVLEVLKRESEFILGITESGGYVELIVGLDGEFYVGDTIPWSVLALLSELKVNLGIEVFP